ncbi:MAG: 1-acyl-sn-glycerol-3-phosphate acyltransferase [Intrasporangium sp.]|uniref:lysophospholipid acyltransferase family protein n=1 Tax=Intrasporangium sp. TaxID=1925024 RepID=UPI002648067B|nr:lysophospholipid acyltransferase family protein [Intrasporangium sp.]MDN5794730.1 1-acyl-sn-glycerol-3-phosphate acyltransferase [Intrasporangium sp.]
MSEARAKVPMTYRALATFLRPLLMATTKRDWRGTEHFPTHGGFVVAPNHISYVDPLVFAHFMYDSGRPAYFLGKDSLFEIPIVGGALRRSGQIPVYRNSLKAAGAYQAAVAAIRAGKPVGIFPEGTITRDPGLWPMRGKTGAARVALETRCPLIPVAQWGAQEILAPYARRPKVLPRRTISMAAGPAVDLSDLYDRPIDTAALRTATDRLMTRITMLLEGIRGEHAAGERYDPRRRGVPETGDPTGPAGPGHPAPRDDTNGDQ